MIFITIDFSSLLKEIKYAFNTKEILYTPTTKKKLPHPLTGIYKNKKIPTIRVNNIFRVINK